MFYFGFEIFKAWQVYGLSEVSHVAHIAHFGGFILAYATLPILKKNIEWEGEIELGEITAENPFEGVDEHRDPSESLRISVRDIQSIDSLQVKTELSVMIRERAHEIPLPNVRVIPELG